MGERTRERLLSAAHDVFAEMGYEPTRVADITIRAGVSHGSFYTYFRDKRQIMETLAQRLFGSLRERALSVPQSEPQAWTPEMVIGHGVHAYLELYRAE